MKKTKLIMLLLMTLLISLYLYGCGKESIPDSSTDTSNSEKNLSDNTSTDTVETSSNSKDTDETSSESKDTDKTSSESKDTDKTSSESKDTDKTSSESEDSKVAAPEFEVTLLSGETVNISDYRGKVVLINFWASWCGPCVGELPALEKLSNEYDGNEVVILAINVSEEKESVSDFIKENKYTFLTGLDENSTIYSLFGQDSIPYTLILDQEGNIAHTSVGAKDSDTMYEKYKSSIDEVLDKTE